MRRGPSPTRSPASTRPTNSRRGPSRSSTIAAASAAAFRPLAERCPSAPGCTEEARQQLLWLDHAADGVWAVTAAGLVATVAIHLVLRFTRPATRAAILSAPRAASLVLAF